MMSAVAEKLNEEIQLISFLDQSVNVASHMKTPYSGKKQTRCTTKTLRQELMMARSFLFLFKNTETAFVEGIFFIFFRQEERKEWEPLCHWQKNVISFQYIGLNYNYNCIPFLYGYWKRRAVGRWLWNIRQLFDKLIVFWKQLCLVVHFLRKPDKQRQNPPSCRLFWI